MIRPGRTPAGCDSMKSSDPKSIFSFRLNQLLRLVQVRLLVYGALRFLAAGAVATLAAIWSLGGVGESGPYIGTGMGLSLGIGLLILFWRFLIRPWRMLRRRRDLVRFLETRGDFANLLVSSEEACRMPERWSGRDPIAQELKRRLFQRSIAILDILDPGVVYPVTHRGVMGTGLVLAVLVGAGMFITAPEELSRGLDRLLHPRPEISVPATGGLYAEMSPGFVVVGEDFEMAALDFAGGLAPTVCEIRTGTGSWRPLNPRMEWIYPERIGLPPPGRRWTGMIEAAHEDFFWRFRRGTLVTAERSVRVRHHPLLTRLGVTVRPPEYTELPVQDLARLPSWIEVPMGSSLRLVGDVNQTVSRGRIVTSRGDTLDLAVDGNQVEGEWLITEAQTFGLELVNGFGLHNQSPVLYDVEVALDQDPVIHLERLGDDGILPIEGELTLQVAAVDDFGLAGLDLLLRTVSPEGTPLGMEFGSGHRDNDSIPAGDDEWQGGPFWPQESVGDGSPDSWISLVTFSGTLQVRPLILSGEDEPGLGMRFVLEVRAGGLDLVPCDAL